MGLVEHSWHAESFGDAERVGIAEDFLAKSNAEKRAAEREGIGEIIAIIVRVHSQGGSDLAKVVLANQETSLLPRP
jgi:hypothetical protein